jgi:hypothetical protein
MADPSAIIGTWTEQVSSNLVGSTGLPVDLGVIILRVFPDGTFDEFFQLQNGQSEEVGRYAFDGFVIQSIVDDYQPKELLGTPVEPPPGYQTISEVSVAFSPDGGQMAIGADTWNLQSHDPDFALF